MSAKAINRHEQPPAPVSLAPPLKKRSISVRVAQKV